MAEKFHNDADKQVYIPYAQRGKKKVPTKAAAKPSAAKAPEKPAADQKEK